MNFTLLQQRLNLDREDVDFDQVWCSFTRPLKGDSINSLRLDTSKYFFYFWGAKNGSGECNINHELITTILVNLLALLIVTDIQSKSTALSIGETSLVSTDLYIPKRSAIRRSRVAVDIDDGYFNEVVYHGAAPIVTASCLQFVVVSLLVERVLVF